MAVRGWGGSVATAIGVAAGAGAAQLGFGYGLGIIAWLPSDYVSGEANWVASLSWAVWIAATSTVAGAICAHRLSRPRHTTDPKDTTDLTDPGPGDTGLTDPGPAGTGPANAGPRDPGPTGTGATYLGSGQTRPAGHPRPSTLGGGLWRVVLAVSSAIGGLVTVLLVAVPARAAVRADASAPQTVAAGYALVGVLIGLLVAIWAISSPAVAANLLGTVGWLWALAVIAVIDDVLAGRGLVSAQLGVWQPTSDGERLWFRDYFYWPGAALSLGSALLIGMFAARSAARRPTARVGTAVSGVSGPLLVAVAYFLAAPGLVGIRSEQLSAHLLAPYAVIAGLAGSALVATLAQRSEARTAYAAALAQRGEAYPIRSTEPREPWSAALGQPADAYDRPVSTAADDVASVDEPVDRTRPPRLPAQPRGGSRRNADDADPAAVRLTDEPANRPASEAAGNESEQSGSATRPSDSAVGQTGGSGSDGSTPDPTPGPAVDSSPEGRSKSRLGRLGRRSR